MFNYPDFAINSAGGQANAYESEALPDIIGRISESMPDRYQDMFPEARKLKRHFIVHIGPTNSGKTHDAIAAFMAAGNGAYLAPLRLLAYEIYESSNSHGCPCSMVTGEEELITGNARHVSSTIEMADLHQHYDVCVIDEAQLLADCERGGAWTAAIVGVLADVIHICSSECAKQMIISLIESCGDTYEVVDHFRAVPLIADEEEFLFPYSVKKNDALIVFSKRSVIHAAAELQKRGWKVSIVYGALPYESRRTEIDRFISGDTDVVIATDAIGMGMNLPVERVVFLETEKFDGKKKRSLTEQEVKQIAGRAGRRGIYETGYYNSMYRKQEIIRKLNSDPSEVRYAYLDFPDTLLNIDGPLSILIDQWNKLPVSNQFRKRFAGTEIELARELEEYTDNKELIYKFITIPFESRDFVLHTIWKKLFLLELNSQHPESYMKAFLTDSRWLNSMDLSSLEKEYRKCDLLYNYLRKFQFINEREEILEHKRNISWYISSYLEKQELPIRKCSCCGKDLPWNYPYGLCNSCYRQSYYSWY